MGVYSFLNVQANISGPGGSITIGSTSGNAKEGISVAFEEDKGKVDTGADGSIMHSLRAGMTGTVTIRLLKTSPTNGQISQLFNFQRTGSGTWGQNTIRVTDTVRGDVVSAAEMAFVKHADNEYHEDGNILAWSFRGVVNESLGTGTADLNNP